MMERRFEIRWEISKTLIHNASLKDKVKRNKKTIVEAIKIASYLNDECVQKRNSNTVNQIFFGEKYKDRTKAKHLVERGRIGFAANKRRKTPKTKNNGSSHTDKERYNRVVTWILNQMGNVYVICAQIYKENFKENELSSNYLML